MIEIIRQEDAGESYTPRELPKDIKQIGSPDIGDRIYVEDGAYQVLHPYDSLEEKRAYVLLGKFENCSGRQCVFVEAVIPLLEMAFDGELPLWNDHTWAYIYKQLKREYDSMVIVGWAMDIKGQLPNMTVRLENLHQSHFGGAHQLLLLMDSLEREEAFYSNRNGHLYRREGFYIYYDKRRAKARAGVRRVAEQTDADTHDYNVQSGFAGSISIENGMREEPAAGKREEMSQSGGMSFEERMRMDEPETEKRGNGLHGSGMSFEERMRTDEPEGKEKQALSGRWIGEGEISGEKERERRRESEREEEPSWGKFFKSIGTGTEPRGEYRKRVMEEEEAKRTPSYASTLLLAMVVCALGVTAFLNHEKMEAMEETLAQMRQTQTISTEETTEQTEGTELAGMPEVEVETVAGNVKKQDDAADGADGAAALANTDADGADAANGAGTSANTADVADTTAGAANGSTAAGSANTAGSAAAGGEGAADGANAADTTGNAATAAGGTNTAGTAAGAGSTDTADSASGTGSTDTAGTAGETAVTTEAQTYLNQGYYVVQKGDSLVGICRKIYQTTAMMDKLCEVNGIEDEDSIYAGQYLTLPN